ncbi:hypothetical protein OAA53_00990 [Salibacteraceae bacterium]|nr:hypothetical protein [Salibacteraceae bacterium]
MKKIKATCYKTFVWSCFLMGGLHNTASAKRVPSIAENIGYCATFSESAPKSWGDDDNVQVYFVSIAKNSTRPFYIRVFDADVGGMHDMAKSGFNSTTSFTIYGGKGAYSNKAAKGVDPIPGYDAGIKIIERKVGEDPKLDNNWMTIGPLNPKEGELDNAMGAYIFKFIIKGEAGDDGNLYHFYLTSQADENIEIPGSNAFCYEMSLRVPSNSKKIMHLYPYIDNDVINVKVHNFDFDNGGNIRLTSVVKNSHAVKASADGNWVTSIHDVSDKERNTSFDLNVLDAASFSNDMTIFVTNQYDEALPFFTKPINGVPKFDYRTGYEVKDEE